MGNIWKRISGSLVIFARAFAIALILVLGANFFQIVVATVKHCQQDSGIMWVVNFAIATVGTFIFYKVAKNEGILKTIYMVAIFLTIIILSEYIIWHREEIDNLLTILSIRDFNCMIVGIIITIAVDNTKPILSNENIE